MPFTIVTGVVADRTDDSVDRQTPLLPVSVTSSTNRRSGETLMHAAFAGVDATAARRTVSRTP